MSLGTTNPFYFLFKKGIVKKYVSDAGYIYRVSDEFIEDVLNNIPKLISKAKYIIVDQPDDKKVAYAIAFTLMNYFPEMSDKDICELVKTIFMMMSESTKKEILQEIYRKLKIM
ncbi:hypothetical protein DRJ17_04045 [Candidatus Woesearchaeota archaeon]|nr:MAG: hypothetical protein DRJ17_04045 [Candidatus Woesearchaeota archaeon]